MSLVGILSGIEMALWDIIGKDLDKPIYELLGGRVHEKIRSYTYLYPAKPGDPWIFGDPEGAARRAAAYVDQGFTGVKFDPVMPFSAFDPRQLSLEALDNAERVVGSVREAVGSKCDLLIGTHGQMTTSSAIRLAKRLEKFDPLWLEEPVPPENIEEMARVARSTSIPVATGERLATKYEFTALLEKQAASILQFALGRVGGILEAKKIAGIAEAHYAELAPHLYCGPIEAAANIQIDACSPNFLIQESIETWGGFHAEILKEPIKWEDGYILPPTAPGLGVELDEEVAAQHPYAGDRLHLEMVDVPVY
jgi:2-dehydro-3-deoxyphosphogalactonate aldolase